MAGRRGRDSTTDQARTAIKEYMLQQHLQPGDALPTESELADRFQVSRSSIREAIRTLSAIDVVEVRHGIGTFVGGLTFRPLVEGLAFRSLLLPGDGLQPLRDILQVREALDLSTADALVATMQGKDHPQLRSLVAEMTERSGRGEGFEDADRAFHSQLLDLIGNSVYAQMVTAFWDLNTALRPQLGISTQPADICDTAIAHGTMLDAAESGDAEAFRAAVRAHYAPLRRVIAAVDAEA